MSTLDLADIQGNIHRPYGRFGFPHSRHFFFTVHDAEAGRVFVQAIRPRVTTAEPWEQIEVSPGVTKTKRPPITLNIGFTWGGLRAIGVPTRTLRLFPDEFIEGMRYRAPILGDIADSDPERWDAAWHGDQHAHIWVSLNAGANPDGSMAPIMGEWTTWIEKLVAESKGGVTLLTGHGKEGTGKWQDSSAVMEDHGGVQVPTAAEHFGFTDGISDPAFRNQYPDASTQALQNRGGGKLPVGQYDPDHLPWDALETGEFILGNVDEGQELPSATQPAEFARNGTFMVYRKLREDVAAFEATMDRLASEWMHVTGETDKAIAGETVRAKIVGRWRSGLPLIVAPTWADHQRIMTEWGDCPALMIKADKTTADRERLAAYTALFTDYRYGEDPEGRKCPMGAHVRRANPRDMLDPAVGPKSGSTTLVNRRRIIRRGLPYDDGNGECGVIFMVLCASLFRQFEFVQQQWIDYGLDFDAGNDSCPLIGNHVQSAKHVIPSGPANDATFIAANLPAFVATRGGDYFFIPGMNAIRMLAMGTVDPT